MFLIDITDRSTWPPRLSGLFPPKALKKVTDLSVQSNSLWQNALPTECLIAYHATRLLPHEENDIRNNGLAPFSKVLLQRKIADALSYKYITLTQADAMSATSLYPATGKTRNRSRKGTINFFLPGDTKYSRKQNTWRYLKYWGGELINFNHTGNVTTTPAQYSIGQPRLIKVALPLTSLRDTFIWPELPEILADHSKTGSISYTGNIPASDIINILPPTDPEYKKLLV